MRKWPKLRMQHKRTTHWRKSRKRDFDGLKLYLGTAAIDEDISYFLKFLGDLIVPKGKKKKIQINKNLRLNKKVLENESRKIRVKINK